MESMWSRRERPVPLDYEAVMAGKFVLRGEIQVRRPSSTSDTNTNGHLSPQLRDQRSLTLPESLDLLVSRCATSFYSMTPAHCRSVNRLSSRLQSGEAIITFDKDDDDTLDFVTAASNLRSAVYNIPQKNRWDVKGKSQ